MSRWVIERALVVVLAVVLVSVGLAEAKQREEFDWSGAVSGAVELRNINGEVEVRQGSGDVEIHAVKTGRYDDPSTVTIEIVEHGEGITVCAVYPGGECLPGGTGDGRGLKPHDDDNDVSVDFTLHLPDGVDFRGGTVNGNVEIDHVGGNVHAHTVNGNIEAVASGWIVASTVNGNVDAEMGSADWDDDVKFRTVNGDITLSIPAGFGADLKIKTLNGRISTDLPLEIDEGKFVGTKARGEVGGGGPRVHIETVNGSVRIEEN